MKAYFTVSLATTVVLLSSTNVYAAANQDQTLEPVTLAAAEGNSDGSSQLSPLSPAPQIIPSAPAPSAAGPQLTVGTTKIGLPLDRVGSFATIVTKQQIQQMQANSILDVLKRVPGVDVVQNGGLGQTASIFIRGMNSEHTMVLVDGIEVNDPMSPGRTFNFPDQLSLDSVDRIEILRGPQSQLYGSDALAGVINIITDVGAEKQTAYIKTQGGSYGTVQGDADWRGNLGGDKVRYTLHAMQQRTAGFSSAGSRYGNPERDGFRNLALSSRVALQPLPNVSLNLITSYANSKTALDNFGGASGDDPNYTMRNKTLFLGGRSRMTLLNGRFEQITRFSVNNQNRQFMNNLDAAHQNPYDYSLSHYHGQMMKVDVQNNFRINETNKLTGGVEITNERGSSDYTSRTNIYDNNFMPVLDANGNPVVVEYTSNYPKRTATNVGLYLQDYIQHSNRWFTTAGVRWDEYNRFGSATTYRGASTYLIPETGTTLRASYGTGFKAPTLYELYAPFYGSPQLKAEKSKGWDIGVEQKLFKNSLFLGATYFHNHVDNMIQGNPSTFVYQNIGKAQMQGSEVYSSWTPTRWLTTRASYTATFAQNLQTHQELLRRPHHKASFNINIQPTAKLNINFDITHVGSAMDLGFNPVTFASNRLTLKPYTLINMALSYKLAKNCTIFGRLVNILDTPYETVKGYGSPRISAYGGLQLGI